MGIKDAPMCGPDSLLDKPQVDADGGQGSRRILPHGPDEDCELPRCLGHQQQEQLELLVSLRSYFGVR